jgi:hypothetical protein
MSDPLVQGLDFPDLRPILIYERTAGHDGLVVLYMG